MIVNRRTIANLLLALLIALTSATMAVARGTMRDATGTIVLCTGTGPVTVQVNADGEPIGPVHICPDCAIGAFDTLNERFEIPARISIQLSTVFAPDSLSWTAISDISVRARGPPSV